MLNLIDQPIQIEYENTKVNNDIIALRNIVCNFKNNGNFLTFSILSSIGHAHRQSMKNTTLVLVMDMGEVKY